jgi:serine/threonine-protein kinase RsbW
VDATIGHAGEHVMESGADAVADRRPASGLIDWPAEYAQLAAIRAEAHRRLASLDLPDDAKHDLVLAVNEAATNAIEHAYLPGAVNPRVELAFWLDDGSLFFAVIDHGTWREPPIGPRGRGFGLDMMRRLVTDVEIDHDGRGTRVLLQHSLLDLTRHPDRAAGLVCDDGTER